jgi:hypothetical protein
MKDKMETPWTSRQVLFECFPKTSEEKIDEFTDALCEYYWKRRARHSISSTGNGTTVTMCIGNHPWWVPKWWARRRVVDIAATVKVGGSATYVIERSVLDDRRG